MDRVVLGSASCRVAQAGLRALVWAQAQPRMVRRHLLQARRKKHMVVFGWVFVGLGVFLFCFNSVLQGYKMLLTASSYPCSCAV